MSPNINSLEFVMEMKHVYCEVNVKIKFTLEQAIKVLKRS
jgi:hypothetical protein